ncbi:MAG: peptide deformylase [Lewinella sp.]|nr:peptide deformylase [Lewinella sp.]
MLALLLGGCASERFSSAERMLVEAAGADVPLRVFKINSYTDSLLLRTPSRAVKARPNDPVLQLFLQRLLRTVQDPASLGVGIAAPQVGLLRNVIYVQRLDQAEAPFEAYLNPRILQYSVKKQDCTEGCLSIPERRGNSGQRAYAILVAYDRPDGSHHQEMVEGFTAVIFQHEIDHLNGILFLDHLKEEVEKAKQPK